MLEIKEILLRVARGESKKRIWKELGVHRKTIRRYIALSQLLGVDPICDGPGAITDELIENIKEKEQEDNHRNVNPSYQLLFPLKERIENNLDDGLKGSKILQLLRREGIVVTEASFYRFLRQNCASWIRKKLTVRLPETEPGDYAQCDFARLGKIHDAKEEKDRIVYAFIMTLCFSRHQFVQVSFKQDYKAVIKGCEDAFRYFGGIPRRLIFDNMKPIVTKYDRYNPTINRSFLEYSQYRGFTIDPAPAKMGTGKPLVERTVPYVRENFFAGEKFLSLEDVQERVIDWCTNVAGKRIHQTIQRRPMEVFEREEKHALLPYDGKRYDIPEWALCKVHSDLHIRFGNALYSAPLQYKGKKVQVRGDSVFVKLYFNGKLIKMHNRVSEGKRSTDFNDYPPTIAPYTMRNPDYQIQEGYKRHQRVGAYIEALLSGSYPWHRLRSAQKLLRLCDKYGADRVALVCDLFHQYEVYDVTRIERMLKKGREQLPILSVEREEHSEKKPAYFERSGESFNHYKLNGGK